MFVSKMLISHGMCESFDKSKELIISNTAKERLPVRCPLSFQGNEGILPKQRAGVDLSIWSKKLG